MNNSFHKVISPSYLKSFKCIKSACEDCCCTGWGNIAIDTNTYEKYKTISDPILKEIIESRIIIDPTSINQTYCAKFDLGQNSCCPLLTVDKLCLMQLKQGENFLPYICATYPRIYHKINGTFEKSVFMSCSEAARIALLNPKGIEFCESYESGESIKIISKLLDTQSTEFIESPCSYIVEIRNFALWLLKNRTFPLSSRLLILGLFSAKVMECCELKMYEKIPELIDLFIKEAGSNSTAEVLTQLPRDIIAQFGLFNNLIPNQFLEGIGNRRFLECFRQFLMGIDYNFTLGIEKIVVTFRRAFENYYQPFMKHHEYILENYVVNYVFSSFFPYVKESSVFEEYILLVLHYTLIRMLLIGISGFHKGLTEEHTVILVQSLTKIIDHNSDYLNQMYDYLLKNGFNTLNYMSILIKD